MKIHNLNKGGCPTSRFPRYGHKYNFRVSNHSTYELFSNTSIPASIKQWLDKKGIAYTELLD